MSTFVELPVEARTAEPGVDLARVAVIVPTCNAARYWSAFSAALRSQGILRHQVLIIDSTSDDATRELAARDGFLVERIERYEFNHGRTRQIAVNFVPWADVVVYLTQDAVLASPNAIGRLLEAFDDPVVAAAYGRQLPRQGANDIEAHARLFNYPMRSEVRDYDSRHALGIKAAFLSNSFAAYRVNRLAEVGGFPFDAILSEDAIVAGKLLLAGWKTAYVADAQVYHSHAFSAFQEFRRYFDIGVCHRRESWLRGKFGNAGSEGVRFVRSELSYLSRRSPYLIPYALVRSVVKAAGYQIGLRASGLSANWSRRMSYHKAFWDTTAAGSPHR